MLCLLCVVSAACPMLRLLYVVCGVCCVLCTVSGVCCSGPNIDAISRVTVLSVGSMISPRSLVRQLATRERSKDY